MTTFSPDAKGRKAAADMMKKFGHTNVGQIPDSKNPYITQNTTALPQKNPPVGGGVLGTNKKAPSSPLKTMASTLTGRPASGSSAVPTNLPKMSGPLGSAQTAQTAQTAQSAVPTNLPKMSGPLGSAQTAQRPAPIPPPMSKNSRFSGAKSAASAGKTMKSGGSVSSASKRADGCAIRGKTKA